MFAFVDSFEFLLHFEGSHLEGSPYYYLLYVFE